MTLIVMEGFDFWNPAVSPATPGWVLGQTLDSGTGRFSGNSLRQSRTTGLFGGVSTFTFTNTQTTLILGCAIDWNSTGQMAVGFGTAAMLQWNNHGHVEVWNNSGIVATGTAAVTTATWHYYELKIFFNGASGTYELHTDGVLDASGTANFGSTAPTTIFLQMGGGGLFYLDDVYVCNTLGSTNKDFLGDVRITTQMPTSAGTHTQWQANGAASNWQCVDEIPADGDTTYVSDANPGDIDTYTYADVDGGATVFGVRTVMEARKDDANTRQIAVVARQSGTDYVGTTDTLGSTYAYFTQLYDQDPTGSNWTPTNYNADEFGVKEIA